MYDEIVETSQDRITARAACQKSSDLQQATASIAQSAAGSPQHAQILLPITGVAERFGRSPRTVRWWIATGRLPVVRIGRTPFVPVKALEQLIDEALTPKSNEVNQNNDVE